MEHFFSAIATVMSNQLRGAVQKALNDFIGLLEVYNSGNSYTGEYERGLPTLKNAIVIGLVSGKILDIHTVVANYKLHNSAKM